jgi:hypothetical protein
MGECVQTFLFPNQKSMEVTKWLLLMMN